ncbi:MAG: hypothetical protein Q8Q13_00615, partial [bacterium]|nr:hypothetical protein [bacterium]
KQRDVEDSLMKDRQDGKGVEGAAYKTARGKLQAEADAARQVLQTAENDRSNKMPQLETDLVAAEAGKRVKDAALEAAHQAALQQQPYADLNTAHVAAEASLTTEQNNRTAIVNDSAAKIRNLETIIANSEDQPDGPEVQDAKAAIAKEKGNRAAALGAQDEKIRTARTEAERIKAQMVNLDPAVQGATAEAETAGKEVDQLQTEITALDTAHANARQAVVDKIGDINSLDNTLATNVRRDAQKVVADSGQIAIEYVQTKAHHRATNFISWKLLGEKPGDDATAEVARRMAKVSIRQLGLREQLRALNSLQGEVGGAAGGGAPAGGTGGGGGGATPAGGAGGGTAAGKA